MNNEPINPKNLVALNKPWNDERFAGGKQYIPVLSGDGHIYRARKVFERRSQAQEYAEKLLAVWKRVYPIFQRLAFSDQLSEQSEPTPEPVES
jgi:hypothetical protein